MRKWYVAFHAERRIGFCTILLSRYNGLDRESGIYAAVEKIREKMGYDRETVIIITFFQELLG